MNDEGIEIDCWLVGQNAMQNILLGQAIDTVVAFDSEAKAEDEDTESDDGFYDDHPEKKKRIKRGAPGPSVKDPGEL